MLSANKNNGPVERVIGDIDRQIADLERQLQTVLTDNKIPTASCSSTLASSVCSWFAPPSRRPAVPSHRDHFEVRADPLRELEADAIPFGREPDLFQQAESSEKLAHYLGAEVRRKPLKPLKHVQQSNRRKFYLWLGLSIIVVALLLIVVR